MLWNVLLVYRALKEGVLLSRRMEDMGREIKEVLRNLSLSLFPLTASSNEKRNDCIR